MPNKKAPKADEFYRIHYPDMSPEEAMKEFAKIHVQCALLAASKEAPGDREEVILNCYPMSNIK